MLRWLLAAIALGGCAEMEKPAPSWATLDGKPPLVIAHRGASGYRPEHTLEAYALAINMGADVVEPDLVFSKDGVLIARHDRYLSTTTDVAEHTEFAVRKRANDDPADTPRDDWWVEDFTLAELKTLRARQPFPGRSKEFDGVYEIPTFDELLALVAQKSREAGRPVGVYPETKHPGFYSAKGYDFEKPLLAALDDFDAGPVFIQSFEPEILKRLKGETSAKLVQLVYEGEPGAGPQISLEEIAKYADGVGAAKDLIYPSSARSESLMAKAHGLGLFAHAWTLRTDQPNDKVGILIGVVLNASPGDSLDADNASSVGREIRDQIDNQHRAESELQAFFHEGVDGVFTDFPDTAVATRTRMNAVHKE
jgi:glycerophosphoryl diester phosphodiesterase